MRSQGVCSRSAGAARGRVERQGELALLPSAPGHGLRARHEPELPEEHAAQASERVAGPRGDERLQPRPVERRPLRQLAHSGERPAPLPLGDDRLRLLLAERADVFEPDAHGLLFERALGLAPVHVRRAHLDPSPLRVAHERRRRVEAHRLLVQERAEELARVVVPQPGRLVREQPERGRVRLREAERREPVQLLEDHLRRLAVDPSPERPVDEALVERLDRLAAALAAHRPPQPLRLADREARERDRDREHLLLEDDDPERLAQRLLEQRMVVRRHERRVLAQAPPVLDVRMDGAALDRPRPHERDLHRQVLEVLGPRAQERLHLRPALDLEDPDRVRALDLGVDRPVVERDPREVDCLAVRLARSARRSPRPPRASRARAGRS